MATSLKGRSGVTTNVREKSHSLRGISSCSLPTKSPKPSLSTTSAKTMVKKQSPRPTETSNTLDSLTKPNTESSANKQATTTTRRRSLDRHAPPSQTQKSTTPIRSTSFSVRSSTRAAPERQSSLGKRDVIRKSGESKSRSTLSKPTTLPSKVVRSKEPSSTKVTRHKRNDSSNSIEHLVSDEDIAYTKHDIPSLPEMSEMPDSNEELKDPSYHYFEPKHDVVEKTLETSEKDCEITIEKQVEEDETVADQDKPIDQMEERNDEDGAKEGEKGEEEEIQVEEKKEIVVICSRSASPAFSPPHVTSNAQEKIVEKRENIQAYNDVIEQTASKLRGNKNKVLALAGAFETVISLQN